MGLTEASQDFDLTFDELQGLFSCFGRSSFLFLSKTTTSTDAVVVMLLNEFGRCSTKLPPLFFSRADSDMHLVNVMRCLKKTTDGCLRLLGECEINKLLSILFLIREQGVCFFLL